MNLVLSLTKRCNLRCSYCYYNVSQESRSLTMFVISLTAIKKSARAAQFDSAVCENFVQ